MKFGGTSVASPERWESIAKIIAERRREGHRVLVVCSALSGVSNLLEELIANIENGTPTDKTVAQLRRKHHTLCKQMGVSTKAVKPWLHSLSRLIDGIAMIGLLTDELRARIMAHGEMLSTTIGQTWLESQGVEADWRDARELLTPLPTPIEATQSRRYLSAVCSSERNDALIKELGAGAPVVITQGFIARDEHGRTVLLGRGGSDTSGAYFAAQLRAARLEIWTDVPGIFTANPKDRPDARLLRLIGYEEAQVMVATGARVLHPRCLQPVADAGIPLHIRCTLAPDMEGTVISGEADYEPATIKALSTRHKLYLIRLYSPGIWNLTGWLADVTNVFRRHGVSIDLIANSPQHVTLTMDPAVTPLGPFEEENLRRDLAEYGELEFHQNAGSVSLIGTQITTVIDQLAAGLSGISDSNIHLVNQASSRDGLSFVMDPDDVDRVLNPLHDWLLTGPLPERIFGPSWEELANQFPSGKKA
ncbi:MAG: aspartate kinase [Gammaproteobacteria bacterium]|nr:aspartate kinase [Gammaproteobacteria bacterium]